IRNITNEQESTLKSFDTALQPFQSLQENIMPPWLAASITSFSMTTVDYVQQKDHLKILTSSMVKEHSDNSALEKIRLINLGHIYSEELKFIDALNCWEEALELKSYIPNRNGEYFRWNNLFTNGFILFQIE
ncbi:unnamed protein product, partial [Rotaria sp. Silwood2]